MEIEGGERGIVDRGGRGDPLVGRQRRFGACAEVERGRAVEPPVFLRGILGNARKARICRRIDPRLAGRFRIARHVVEAPVAGCHGYQYRQRVGPADADAACAWLHDAAFGKEAHAGGEAQSRVDPVVGPIAPVQRKRAARDCECGGLHGT